MLEYAISFKVNIKYTISTPGLGQKAKKCIIIRNQ